MTKVSSVLLEELSGKLGKGGVSADGAWNRDCEGWTQE